MAVHVAGIGAVCAAGNGVDTAFNAIRHGSDYLKPFSFSEIRTTTFPLCATVDCDLELLAGREGLFRTLALAIAATDEAIHPLSDPGDLRIGVVAATTVGGISQTEHVYHQYHKNPRHITTLAVECAVHEPSVLSADICRRIGGCGFHTVSTACSSSLHAIGMAKRLIEHGHYDACLVVGADALCITTVRGFNSLTLLDPVGCRPFDAQRAGISLGEGAGAMLLVSEECSGRITTPMLATVDGWGASSDCFHMTAPHPEGEGAYNAITKALAEAAVTPDTIDLIVAHGTGTPDNDKSEIATLKKVFPVLPPFCSLKRTLGHTLAASGILESVLGIKIMQEHFIPPTAGFSTEDEQMGTSPAAAHEAPVKRILKNAFGFGGNNAAIIFSATETAG